MPDKNDQPMTRQEFLNHCGRSVLLLALGGGVGGLLARQARAGELVWQIDPAKCTWCGLCATECVLDQSAVRCMNVFEMCGYCDLCTGYFGGQPGALNEGAENQVCPTGALVRRFVEDPYFEYVIDAARCIGCARCVQGCVEYGNGSLYLQIQHDKCVHCNECSIAAACPAQAIARVAAARPYLSPLRPAG